MGALIFTNQTWFNTLPLIEASGLPLGPGIAISESILYGPGNTASALVPALPLTEQEKALLSMEFTKYASFWMTEFAPKFTAMRYTVCQLITHCFSHSALTVKI